MSRHSCLTYRERRARKAARERVCIWILAYVGISALCLLIIPFMFAIVTMMFGGKDNWMPGINAGCIFSLLLAIPLTEVLTDCE